MKQHIIDDICQKLDELQIPFSLKNDSTIYVSTDFYEIGYGADFKKISYELTVFLDEQNRSVSMYVKTVDQCLVAANGETREVPAPSTTMFRKVKRYVHDGDGQGSVVTTDLGEVPNTVKNTAFKYGWKFSTALNLNKFTKSVEVNSVRLTRPEVPEHIPESEPEEPVSKPGVKAKKKGIVRRLFGGK
jgi:hypothetical protein